MRGRIAHADDDGWDWRRTFRLAAAHLADPAASPRDLAAAARGPFERDVPGDYGSRAAEARQLLGYDPPVRADRERGVDGVGVEPAVAAGRASRRAGAG